MNGNKKGHRDLFIKGIKQDDGKAMVLSIATS